MVVSQWHVSHLISQIIVPFLALAMLSLDMRHSGVLLAQMFWWLWLLFVGSLVFRSEFLPRWLGELMLPVWFLVKGVSVERWLGPSNGDGVIQSRRT
jgi:Domain of unknown function (DUF4386)